MDLDVARRGRPLELVTGLGDLSYFYPLDLGFLEIVSLNTLTGDGYVTFTFTVADPQMDPETGVLQLPQAQEWLKSLAQPDLGPVP